MSLRMLLLALLALPLGFGTGTLVRSSFPWSRNTVTVLVLVTLLPWFVHHGRVLDALRFGAVQSQWTHPDAFNVVHAAGYLVAAVAALGAGLLSKRVRWALVFAPGVAFVGTLLVTLPLATRALAEGYFLVSSDTTSMYWVGTMAGTGLLLGYCWNPRPFAPSSGDSAAWAGDAEHGGTASEGPGVRAQ